MVHLLRHRNNSRVAMIVEYLVSVMLLSAPIREAGYPKDPSGTNTQRISQIFDGTVVRVDPTAWTTFPSATSNAWCAIIAIEGLGSMDGDYTVRDTQMSPGERPSWVRATPNMPNFKLSWLGAVAAWAISTGGQHRFDSDLRWFAVLPIDSEVPSSYSTRWRIFDDQSSTYKEVGSAVTVSCPACSTVTVSALKNDFSACNGPYRRQSARDAMGAVSVWSHAIEQQCSLFHDKAGNAFVIRSNSQLATFSIANAQDQQEGAGETGALFADTSNSSRVAWWAIVLNESKGWPIHGRDANVECTSAGRTTRLGFDLLIQSDADAGLTRTPLLGHGRMPHIAEGGNPLRKPKYLLSTKNDGSVFSVAQSNIHFRVSNVASIKTSNESIDVVEDTVDTRMYENSDGVNDRGSFLIANVTVNRKISVVVPADRLNTDGVLIQVDHVEGTHVIELCMMHEQWKGRKEGETPQHLRMTDAEQGCLAEGLLVVETAPTEAYMVERRPSGDVATAAASAIGMRALEGGHQRIPATERRKVAFVLNYAVVDGYSLSTLHLLNHLPANVEASVVDLACEYALSTAQTHKVDTAALRPHAPFPKPPRSHPPARSAGDPPMRGMLERAVGRDRVVSLCIVPEHESWAKAEEGDGTFFDQLHALLAAADDWTQVVRSRPDIARTFGELYHHLAGFSVALMSNAAKDIDGFLLHLARLAGVRSRVVNLGPTAGGYLSPLFDAATSLISPSHYIAISPQVNRNAGGRPIKVCHPVMDVPRLLKAADSCPTRTSSSSDAQQSTTARFVMVARMATEKTPGTFVRAVAALKRRQLLGPDGTAIQIEGVMIGTGALGVPLKRLSETLEVNIRFTGLLDVDLVPCEVLRATALVLPSFAAEPLGMVAPEAMILGIPVVTFGVGGTGEFVRHRENGIVVEELTPKALADALELLARDVDLRNRLGARARSDTLGVLSPADMVGCHINAFL